MLERANHQITQGIYVYSKILSKKIIKKKIGWSQNSILWLNGLLNTTTFSLITRMEITNKLILDKYILHMKNCLSSAKFEKNTLIEFTVVFLVKLKIRVKGTTIQIYRIDHNFCFQKQKIQCRKITKNNFFKMLTRGEGKKYLKIQF